MLARQSRAGLLDEIDGVPLALNRARQRLLPGRGNCDLDVVLTAALLAHPARAFDHHIGRIALFDIEAANLVEIQGGGFAGRVAEASFALALGILGGHDRLEHAFRRRGDSHADPHVAAVTMRIIGLAEVGVWPDRLVLDRSAVEGPPPAAFESLRDRIFLLATGNECDRIEQSCFVRGQWGLAAKNQACQPQQQNVLNSQVSLPGGNWCSCGRQASRRCADGYRSKALHLTLSAHAPGEGATAFAATWWSAREESEYAKLDVSWLPNKSEEETDENHRYEPRDERAHSGMGRICGQQNVLRAESADADDRCAAYRYCASRRHAFRRRHARHRRPQGRHGLAAARLSGQSRRRGGHFSEDVGLGG